MKLIVRKLFKLIMPPDSYLTDIFPLAMIKIAGVKSNDKINFREFVDFFNKVD